MPKDQKFESITSNQLLDLVSAMRSKHPRSYGAIDIKTGRLSFSTTSHLTFINLLEELSKTKVLVAFYPKKYYRRRQQRSVVISKIH